MVLSQGLAGWEKPIGSNISSRTAHGMHAPGGAGGVHSAMMSADLRQLYQESASSANMSSVAWSNC